MVECVSIHTCYLLCVQVPGCQERALDPSIDGCEPLYYCWGLTTVPLEEQQTVLLIAESSFQPL